MYLMYLKQMMHNMSLTQSDRADHPSVRTKSGRVIHSKNSRWRHIHLLYMSDFSTQAEQRDSPEGAVRQHTEGQTVR